MSVHYFGLLSGPHELARHPQVEPEVKRAILASWAYDEYAVRSQPRLRKPPELSRPVAVGEVLDALKALDEE
jgi:hypothetical protein